MTLGPGDPTPAVVSRLVGGVVAGLVLGVVLGAVTGQFTLWLPITVAVGILVAGAYRAGGVGRRRGRDG